MARILARPRFPLIASRFHGRHAAPAESDTGKRLISYLPRLRLRLRIALVALSSGFASGAYALPGAWSYYAYPLGATNPVLGPALPSASGTPGTSPELWLTYNAIPGGPGAAVFPQIIHASLEALWEFTPFDTTGLDNATHDLSIRELMFNRFGGPVAECGHFYPVPGRSTADLSPYLFYYDSAASTWAQASVPAGEEASWPGGPQLATDDVGDLLAIGNHRLLQSTDGRAWTVRADLTPFLAAPPPTQPDYGNANQPGWITRPAYGTNVPLVYPYGTQWVTGFARMPWGELIVAGENSSLIHSLDNGLTWSWFDPLGYQPQRDNLGRPMYPHPAAVRLGQTYSVVHTGTGEVLFNCKNNGGHHFFLWAATGEVVEAAQGLPPGNVEPHPGIAQKFVTLETSGETFMATRWSNYTATNRNPNPPSPTGHEHDVYKWDGVAWTTITEGYLGWLVAMPSSFVSDGTGIVLSGYDAGGLFKWTPDLSAGAPPDVSVVGGSGALGAPSVALVATTGLASLALDAVATARPPDVALGLQWAARGPGPVTFSDAHTLCPTATFSVSGDYVLNLQAMGQTSGLRRGASVIVHVRPALGGTAPVITAQPVNQKLVNPGSPGAGAATFTLQVNGPGPLRYQWKRNGIDLLSASARTHSLGFTPGAADADASYHCVIASPFGRTVSNTAVLGTAPDNTPGRFNSPVSRVVSAGAYASFSVSCTATPPLQWQWFRDGIAIPGANNGDYATATPGAYTVRVTNIFGSALSDPALLANGTPPPGFTVFFYPGASSANSGGIANAGAVVVPAFRPVGVAVPIGVDPAPLGDYDAAFAGWTSATTGGVAVAIAEPLNPQTTVTVTGANASGAQVAVYANFKSSATHPFRFLQVINGQGGGRFRAPATVTPASAPVVAIAALPPPPGRVFERWIGAGVANPTVPQTTVTLSAERTQVTARYVVTFEAWAQTVFGAAAALDPLIAGPQADPDGDGTVNLVEYALGSDAVDVHSRPLIGTSIVVAEPPDLPTAEPLRYLEFTFHRRVGVADATWRVEVSTDLTTWETGPDVVVLSAPVADPGGLTETLRARVLAPLDIQPRTFVRLNVALPE